MTEQGWLACTNPEAMLRGLRGKASNRELYLYAVACCRQIWGRLDDVRSRLAAEVIERYADGLASRGELRDAMNQAGQAAGGQYALTQVWQDDMMLGLVGWGNGYTVLPAAVLVAPNADAERDAWGYARYVSFMAVTCAAGHGWLSRYQRWRAERKSQCGLLRDLFGNSSRPAAFDLARRTSDAISLATSAYEERAFDRLPILADALEEAGCDERALLDHLRGPGAHVRGCWGLDLVLGRS